MEFSAAWGRRSNPIVRLILLRLSPTPRLRPKLSPSDADVLVVATPAGIVGTIAGSLYAAEGHLRGLAVLPAWRGSGLAAKLLHAIEAWLETNGCSRITLDTTLPLAAAMKFYEKNRYWRSGKVSDFFGMPLLEYVKEL